MNLFFSLVGIYILFVLQRFLYNTYWNKYLSVSVDFSAPKAYEGDTLYIEEKVLNQKFLPLPILKIKFMTSKYLVFEDLDNVKISDNMYRNDVIPMLMYQKLTRRLPFLCSHRGYYILNRIDVLCGDIFLTVENIDVINCSKELYVYPKLISNIQFETYSQRILGSVLTKKRISEDPFEFRGIRDYQVFDTMKSINWKATAKTGDIKVNVHDFTCSQQISIFVNLESYIFYRSEDMEEECIRLCASLANLFIGKKIPVSINTNGHDIITKELVSVPSGAGNMHMTSINKCLSRIDTNLGFFSFSNLLENHIADISDKDFIVIISSNISMDIQKILINNCFSSENLVWIIPQKENTAYKLCNQLSSSSIIHYI